MPSWVSSVCWGLPLAHKPLGGSGSPLTWHVPRLGRRCWVPLACLLVPSFLSTRGGGWSQVLTLLHSFRWLPEAASREPGVFQAGFLSCGLCPSALQSRCLCHKPVAHSSTRTSRTACWQTPRPHSGSVLSSARPEAPSSRRGRVGSDRFLSTGEVQPPVILPLVSYLPVA